MQMFILSGSHGNGAETKIKETKTLKKVPDQLLVCGIGQRLLLRSLNRGLLKILNDIKLILDDQGNHLDSYTISLKSFRSFRGPLFPKSVILLPNS